MTVQMQQILETNNGDSGCKKATAPIVGQSFNTVTEESTFTVLNPIAAGQPALWGGTISNKGCADLKVSINYLDGDDCDECTNPDEITTKEVTWVVPKNHTMCLPDGFIVGIEGSLTQAPTENAPQQVDFHSSYTPRCPKCIVVVPGGKGKEEAKVTTEKEATTATARG